MKKIILMLILLSICIFADNNTTSLYVNEKYGFSFEYPNSILTIKQETKSNRGVILENNDSQTKIDIKYKEIHQTFNMAYTNGVKWMKDDEAIQYTYSENLDSWFILSGYYIKNKDIVEIMSFLDKRKHNSEEKTYAVMLTTHLSNKYKEYLHDINMKIATSFKFMPKKNVIEKLKPLCDNNDGASCFKLSKKMMENEAYKNNLFPIKNVLEKGCTLGDIDSCNMLNEFDEFIISKQYKEVGLDELIAFTSDFIDKPIKLYCMKMSVKEERDGKYSVSGKCKIDINKNIAKLVNPFRIELITDKRIAKKIWKNLKYEMYLGGKIQHNIKKFSSSKYMFLIDAVKAE